MFFIFNKLLKHLNCICNNIRSISSFLFCYSIKSIFFINQFKMCSKIRISRTLSAYMSYFFAAYTSKLTLCIICIFINYNSILKIVCAFIFYYPFAFTPCLPQHHHILFSKTKSSLMCNTTPIEVFLFIKFFFYIVLQNFNFLN